MASLMFDFLCSADQFIKRVSGYQLTGRYLQENGFDYPMIVERKDGLGLTIPPANFTVEDIEHHIGIINNLTFFIRLDAYANSVT